MMYQFRLDDRHVHRSLFHSLRVQIVYVLATSLAAPLLVFGIVRGTHVFAFNSTINAQTLAVMAALLTLFTLRQVGGFFGLVLSRWILPTYGTFAAILGGVVIFLRLPYSSVLLAINFVFAIIALYVLVVLMARGKRAICYVIPVGRATELEDHGKLDMITLEHQVLPGDENAIVVADLHADLGPDWERFLTEVALQGHPIYHVVQLREALTGKVQFDHLSENSFGALIPAIAYKKVKRLIDLAASLALLPLLIPMMMVIGLLVKLDSSGPAFFLQRRMGYCGQPFWMVKFRTMTVTEDGEDGEASHTVENDERITRLGRFLRRTRLDELPQVFNILRGEMSWIGPRPEAVSLSRDYASKVPNYRYRHLVRPGITGWAQVHQGHVITVEDIQDKLRYDFYYVKNISFWIDMIIALGTVRVMISGFGAR
ncbi:sugar transferase [Aurantiacibacter hainanensis]|uniref:sugar transferase n=1 Tax=Aurantiacibacter hainanensis TaxID=3076114 RepID=UPI0030C77E7E